MTQPEAIDHLDWTEVDSSNVHSVAFHESSQTLAVRFKSGTLYSYMGPNYEIYADMTHAASVGKYFNEVVKSTYPYTKWEDEAKLIASLNIHKQTA